MNISRRYFLKNTLLCTTILAITPYSFALSPMELTLSAEDLNDGYFAYKGLPEEHIILNKGQNFKVNFTNNLKDQATSIHWHGLRIPNNMDGVPYITQDPINPTDSFIYEFQPHDSGTYFFHPHLNTPEQVERGLKGVFIVKEDNPPIVDAEHILVFDDILLDENGQPITDYMNNHEVFHDGRLGNVFRLNGQADTNVKVQYGQRLRLRLICATNARIFNLAFNSPAAWLIAKDGQSVGEPISLNNQQILFAPGQRLDIIFDIPGDDAQSYSIDLVGGNGNKIALVEFTAEGETINQTPQSPPTALEYNDLPFDISAENATIIDATLRGGMMGSSTPKMQKNGIPWSIGNYFMTEDNHNMKNGQAWRFTQGKDYILRMKNETVFNHPMHMHGHFFKVLNGADAGLWMDTVLVPANETIDILFRADALGKWMFHCHILEHAAAGMMVWFEVIE